MAKRWRRPHAVIIEPVWFLDPDKRPFYPWRLFCYSKGPRGGIRCDKVLKFKTKRAAERSGARWKKDRPWS